MTSILLVEDEPSISAPLAFLLEQEGYRVTVAADGRSGLESALSGTYDLLLLDVMLPELSGTEVCRAVRKTSAVPIIMLTAKNTETDIVVGLELGADDYLTKPYSSRELLARIRAALRRSPGENVHEGSEPSHAVSEICGVKLDAERYTVTVRGAETTFPLREFQLLELLMAHNGKVLTRGQLIDLVWGSNYYGDTKTLDVHVKRIRSKIEVDPAHPTLLVTVRGVGYRFG